ncbi:MAG TPA: redoxin domain-containing protein [Saprospiraceae bacterium]|nr:redoxin domain-containing protein [Saprospiraceae bacterium]HMQ85895.1 redoxin domain-containing protein [Saprospiraceae bacterium]
MRKTYLLLAACWLCLNWGKAQTTAPDFSFTDINGETHHLQHALDQGFIVVIDFFFVDCGPCQISAPEMQAIHEDYEGKNVVIWSISDRDSDAYIENYKSNAGLTYISAGIQGGGASVIDMYANQFNFLGFPTVSVICPDGSINWDIWPYSAGAPQWRNAINNCGVHNSAPYQSVTASGVADFEVLEKMRFMPNPSTGYGTLDIHLQEASSFRLDVLSIEGKVLKTLFEGQMGAGTQRLDIDLSDLPNGIYFLRAQDGAKVKMERLVLQRN